MNSRVSLYLLLVPVLCGQEVRHGTGTWDADTYGTQRAVVRVKAAAGAVRVRVPWRRRDAEPEKKEILVYSAGTGARVRNVARVEVNREFGDLVFQPSAGAGDYWLYYLPYTGNAKSPYPKLSYRTPEMTADAAWLASYRLAETPAAEVIEIQAASELDRYGPMERIATKGEIAKLLAENAGHAFLVFAEDRDHPIRMTGDLPAAWAGRAAGARFEGTAARGELSVFQLGVWAVRAELGNVLADFAELRRQGGG